MFMDILVCVAVKPMLCLFVLELKNGSETHTQKIYDNQAFQISSKNENKFLLHT